MTWFDEARFYHIYPLGLTGAPHTNDYVLKEHRLRNIFPWVHHIKELNCNAIYIGPLFESVGHGYETTDYKKLDSRLGDNQDLKDFMALCHENKIRVIFDAVFNHVGRDFFAFKDLKENREGSKYRDWFCNVNFYGNNYFNDGFSYDNWGGDDGLVKLNQRNPEVKSYIAEVICYWVKEFDVDGLRLDAADVLDFDYMKAIRQVANEVKKDFYLMGEVIHGDYTRWVNEEHLHAVTNYSMNKALWSGNNEHNFFEIAHTQRRNYDMAGQNPLGLRLYNFADNHDVERIASKVNNKAHQMIIYALCYTLPGVPSIYYGSEFGIEGRKEKGSDWNLRPELNIEDYKDAASKNPLTHGIKILGKVREASLALSYGGYKELLLTNRQYAYRRRLDNENVIVLLNNDDNPAWFNVDAEGIDKYFGCFGEVSVSADNGRINIEIPANSCQILMPEAVFKRFVEDSEAVAAYVDHICEATEAAVDHICETAAEEIVENEIAEETEEAVAEEIAEETEGAVEEVTVEETEEAVTEEIAEDSEAEIDIETLVPRNVSYEEMSIEELQHCIYEKMRNNGPVTPEMKKTITDNVYHDSLVNWVKSFR
ncbi:MAG: alpha-amylase [Eubacterium sp.]|nr:alpha-amylase [Eubacterium sp.]